MTGRRVSGFSFGLALIVALAASMGVAHAQCSTLVSTVTCTGGAGASISINGTGDGSTQPGSPFPTTINVTGGGGSLQSMTLTIHGYTADAVTWEGSIYVGLLLVSPSGRNMEILRCLGDGTVGQNNITFTLQDGATRVPSCHAADPNFGVWNTGGTFGPSANIDPSGSPDYAHAGAPALTAGHSPANAGSATLNSVNGVFTGDTVNGNWSLYLVNNTQDGASVSFSSWDIAITFNNATTPSTTTLTPNPTTAYTSSTNSSVVLTANVTANATGTVTFREGATVLTCTQGAQPRPLTVGSPSSAVCTTTFAAEGYHALTASYSGDSTFVASTGNSAVFTQNHSTNVGTVYCNTGAIIGDGQSNVNFTHVNPYPSVIFIGDPGFNTDLPNSVNTLSVQLKNFAAVSNTSDMHMLLVAPDGTHAFDFWGNAGSTLSGGSYTVIDGGTQLPNIGAIGAGSYGATTYFNTDLFTPAPPSPAPQLPGSFVLAPPAGSETFSTAFVGAAAHGGWSLFLYNGSGGGVTTDLNGGWCLNISPATGHATTVMVTSNPMKATTGAAVTFTATVTSTQTVNTGAVTFTENGAPLSGAGNPANVNGSGVATFITTTLPEGDHTIKALYHDSSNTFSDNFGSVTMREDAPTATPTLNGSTWSYCNPTGIVIPLGTVGVNDIGAASPNPSNIFVTNLPGTISSVGLTLKSFHVTSPGDLDSLLVGPNGGNSITAAQTLDFFTGAGGNGGSTAFSHDTSFLDGQPAVSCTAGGPAPGASNAPTSCVAVTPSYFPSPFYTLPGTFQRPTTGGNFTFDTGTYTPNVGGGVYKNTLPNGTWSLYFNQNIHHSGDGASSWCANFTENPVTVTATKGHTGRPPMGHMQQGQHTGASFSFQIKNNGDSFGNGSTGDPDCNHPLTVVDVLDSTAFTATNLPTGSTCTVGMPPPTDWTCTGTTTVTCKNHAAIAPMGIYPILTIPVIVKDNAPASATNQGSLSGGGITATNSTMDSVTIDPAPILAITKAHTGNFTQGQTGSWTLQVANNSATAAGNTNGTTVTVTDTLPAGYTGWSGSGTGWTCVTNTLVVSCTSNEVVAGNGGMFQLITLSGTVPAASPTSVNNSATFFGGGDVVHTSGSPGTSNTDTVTVIQVPAFVNINGSATQSAPINTAFGSLAVTVQDAGHVTIPNYSSVVFTAPASGQSGTFDTTTNTKTLATGTGGSAGVADPGTFTANSTPGAYTMDVQAGTIHATFNLTNTAPDLTAIKSNNAVSNTVNLGGNWTWKVHLANSGTGPANFTNGQTILTDNLPSTNVAYGAAGMSGASGVTGTIVCSSGSNTLSCTASGAVSIAAGGTQDVTVVATPSAAGTFVNPTGGVCTVNPGHVPVESDFTNNSCSDTVTVTAPDLTAVKADNVANATTLGTPWTWNIHLANGGNGAATFANGQTVLTDNLPSTNIGYGSATPSSPLVTTGNISCAIVTNTLTCTASGGAFTIGVNGSIDVSFLATPTAIGTFANPTAGVCKVDPSNVVPESNESNNSCSDTVTVTAPDLTVSKGHSPSTFTVNDVNDTITVTVTNGGNAPSSGTVTVTDTLPAGLTFNGSPTAGWSCSANGVNPVVCTTTNAINGSGGTSVLVLNVNVASSTGSPLSNGVTVACTCTESNTANNTGSDSITVSQVVGITLATSPTGLLVSADGGSNYFTAPHTFQLLPGSMPTIVTQTPQSGGAGTQFVWVSWSDGGAISHTITVPGAPATYTATFKTQFLLTTQVNPNATEGSISPATGFYDSGTVVPVSATANTGYVFTGFTGGLTGTTTPQNITMNSAQTVTANFQPGPTSLGGYFGTTKTGPIGGQRVWTVNIIDSGTGVALGAQVTSFTVVQPQGTCHPTVVSAMPQLAGDIAPGGTAAAHVTIDFTGCAGNLFFTVTANTSANNGAVTGQIKRFNQVQ